MPGHRTDKEQPTASKSQRKREAQALFELGRELVNLDAATLGDMPLPRRLREAIAGARAIKSHIAHKRQLQFIGGLLRNLDVDPIRSALEQQRMKARQVTARHHRVEAWRDRLLRDGDRAMQALVDGHPLTEIQTLRQLMRNANREAKLGKPPAAARKLFRLLRDIDARHPLPPA